MSLLELHYEPSPVVDWQPGYGHGHTWTSFGLVEAEISPLQSDWRKRVIRRLKELMRLRAGWDGYHSGPVSLMTAAYAVAILDSSMRPHTNPPAIVPANGGAVQLEWHEGGLDIELMIYRPLEAELSVHYHDGRSPIEEAALTTNFDTLSDALKELD